MARDGIELRGVEFRRRPCFLCFAFGLLAIQQNGGLIRPYAKKQSLSFRGEILPAGSRNQHTMPCVAQQRGSGADDIIARWKFQLHRRGASVHREQRRKQLRKRLDATVRV